MISVIFYSSSRLDGKPNFWKSSSPSHHPSASKKKKKMREKKKKKEEVSNNLTREPKVSFFGSDHQKVLYIDGWIVHGLVPPVLISFQSFWFFDRDFGCKLGEEFYLFFPFHVHKLKRNAHLRNKEKKRKN